MDNIKKDGVKKLEHFNLNLFNIKLQEACGKIKFRLHGDIVHLDIAEVLTILEGQDETVEEIIANAIVSDYMGWRPKIFNRI